jgi:hypothetical protein
MGAAWERHGMCELPLVIEQDIMKYDRSSL